MNINNFLQEISYELREIEHTYRAIALGMPDSKEKRNEARSLLKRINSIQRSIKDLSDVVRLEGQKYDEVTFKLINLKHNIVELTI